MVAQIRFLKLHIACVGLAMLAPTAVPAATLGRVIPIGGHAADIALDEARRVLYVANYTANRIDVLSLSDYSIKTSMNVAAEPSALSISPDGRFLVFQSNRTGKWQIYRARVDGSDVLPLTFIGENKDPDWSKKMP